MLKKGAIKEFFILTFSAALVAVAIYFFMLPSHAAIGSISAVGMVLNNFIPLPVSAIMLIINSVLLLAGYFLVGPEFGIKTVYTTLMMPVYMGVFETLFPNMESITQNPVLDVGAYILIAGIGIAVLFEHNASSGGLDIVAKLMNKYLRMDVGKAMSISGMLVALSSALVYDKMTVVLSVLGTYFGGMMVDHFIFGLNPKRRVCIISEKKDTILQFILQDLHGDATLYDVLGANNKESHQEIITIVNKHEYMQLMDYVRKVDPKAFITVITVQEISYRPKK